MADKPRLFSRGKETILRIASTIASRAMLARSLGESFGGRRNLGRALGYPDTRELDYEAFYNRYRRDGLAKRIVRLAPQATWSGGLEIVEDEDKAEQTAFEKQVEDLAKRTRLIQRLLRFDTIARLGRYGVMVIGVKGNIPLAEPLEKVNGVNDILFFATYSEANAKIVEWDTEPKSERFCMPKMYQLRTANDEIAQLTKPQLTVNCHWSRLIHTAEGLLEDDVFGEPILEALFNALIDAEKVSGASAESIWKNADRGISWDLAKDAVVDDAFLDKMDVQFDEWEHDQRKNVATQGVTPHVLGAAMADPRGMWEVTTGIIAAGTGYPRRILLGSERGELASQDDRRNWAGVIGERRENYAEPDILRATIDRLIKIKGLPEVENYEPKWPPILVMTDQEKADRAAKIASAVRLISDSGAVTGRVVMSIKEFREKMLELPADLPTDAKDELANRIVPTPPIGAPGGAAAKGDGKTLPPKGTNGKQPDQANA